MTELRFYQNQYESEYTASITSVKEGKEEFLVSLDQTIFYPEGGGQPSDIGWINDIPVTYVEKKDGEVLHHLSRKPEGPSAQCRLDWRHRFDYMQQHTGQHILSGVMYQDFGYNTVAVHQGEEYTTIEIETDSIGEDEIRKIEEKSMEIINSNLPVLCEWTREKEIDKYNLRRPPKVSGNIRVVSIQAYDSVACGGVHTGFTGEVGMLKHVQTEKIRGRIRLYWKIGQRAFSDYSLKNEIVAALVEKVSSQPPELVQRVDAVIQEVVTLRRQADLMEGRLAACTAQKIFHEGTVIRAAGGELVFMMIELEEEGKDFLKKLSAGLPADRSWVLCGVNYLQDSFQWIIAVSEKTDFDFNAYRGELMTIIDGKGGGRPPLWQGVGSNLEGAGAFFSKVREKLSAF